MASPKPAVVLPLAPAVSLSICYSLVWRVDVLEAVDLLQLWKSPCVFLSTHRESTDLGPILAQDTLLNDGLGYECCRTRKRSYYLCHAYPPQHYCQAKIQENSVLQLKAMSQDQSQKSKHIFLNSFFSNLPFSSLSYVIADSYQFQNLMV